MAAQQFNTQRLFRTTSCVLQLLPRWTLPQRTLSLGTMADHSDALDTLWIHRNGYIEMRMHKCTAACIFRRHTRVSNSEVIQCGYGPIVVSSHAERWTDFLAAALACSDRVGGGGFASTLDPPHRSVRPARAVLLSGLLSAARAGECRPGR